MTGEAIRRKPIPRLVLFPEYIDTFIFSESGLKGIYRHDPEGVRSNRHADEKSVRQYLGTYFPRSYAESYLIFRNLFDHPAIGNAILAKRSLSVLNVGSGTGGDTVGLLEAIVDSGFRPPKIEIYSLDCNRYALDCQKRIVDKVASKHNLDIRLYLKETPPRRYRI